MQIEIDISDFALEQLGPEPSASIARLVESEALRLWHIKRSMPRDDRSRPIPPVARRLLTLITKRRDAIGGTTSGLDSAERDVREAISMSDLAGLKSMYDNQIWLRK